MKTPFYIPITLFLLASCGQPASVDTTESDNSELKADELYAGEKVKSMVSKDSLISEEANQLFLNALDAYKNKKELKKANEGFIASIMKFPTAKAYYELGNVLMDLGNYKDALNSYVMAEKLDYAPFSKVLYNIACAHAQLEEYEQSAWYIEYALQAGYANLDEITKDKDLNKLRENEPWTYKKHLKQGMEGMSNPERLFWLQYQKQFAQAKLPLTISDKSARVNLLENAHIAYDYELFIPEMRNERFSREVNKGFYSFAQVADKANYVALLYIMKSEFDSNAPMSYCLMTYTHDGQIIDKKIVAGRESYSDMLKSVSFTKNLQFIVTYEETTYRYDVEEKGYEDNPIIKKEKVKEEQYHIDAKGFILSDSFINEGASASVQ